MVALKQECIATYADLKNSKESQVDQDVINQLDVVKRKAQRKFRPAQRIQVTDERQHHLATIHHADENNKKLFYSIT